MSSDKAHAFKEHRGFKKRPGHVPVKRFVPLYLNVKLDVFVPSEELSLIFKEKRRFESVYETTVTPLDVKSSWSIVSIVGEAQSVFQVSVEIEELVSEVDDCVLCLYLEPERVRQFVLNGGIYDPRVQVIGARTGVLMVVPSPDSTDLDIFFEGSIAQVREAFSLLVEELLDLALEPNHIEIPLSSSIVGFIIGHKGSTIHSLSNITHTQMNIESATPDPTDPAASESKAKGVKSILHIDGPQDCTVFAARIVLAMLKYRCTLPEVAGPEAHKLLSEGLFVPILPQDLAKRFHAEQESGVVEPFSEGVDFQIHHNPKNPYYLEVEPCPLPEYDDLKTPTETLGREKEHKRREKPHQDEGKSKTKKDHVKEAKELREARDIKETKEGGKEKDFHPKEHKDHSKEIKEHSKENKEHSKEHKDHSKEHREHSKELKDHSKEHKEQSKELKDHSKEHKDHSKEHKEHSRGHKESSKELKDHKEPKESKDLKEKEKRSKNSPLEEESKEGKSHVNKVNSVPKGSKLPVVSPMNTKDASKRLSKQELIEGVPSSTAAGAASVVHPVSEKKKQKSSNLHKASNQPTSAPTGDEAAPAEKKQKQKFDKKSNTPLPVSE